MQVHKETGILATVNNTTLKLVPLRFLCRLSQFMQITSTNHAPGLVGKVGCACVRARDDLSLVQLWQNVGIDVLKEQHRCS
jgi:hypothetical protein